MQHDLSAFDVVIFGDFGVLTTTPFREPDGKLAMLPMRVALLADLQRERAHDLEPLVYVVCGNKGGVAFGLQTEAEAEAELAWTAGQIKAALYAVCFAHERPAAGYERYADPDQLGRRKPAPGMFEEIIARLGVDRARVLVVGNYADDCRAAIAAGLAWELTSTFFAPRPTREAQRAVDDFDPFFG